MGKNHDDFLNFKLDGAMGDCNYYLDDGLAFTEDRIIVHNIFLYKISKKVERDNAQKYFERFGEIKKFRFVIKKAAGRRRGTRVGFVHFKEAKAAAEVLSNRCHIIEDSKVVWVKACDTWHQPQGDCFKNEHKETLTDADAALADAETFEIDRTCSIIELDDDCLYVIYKTMDLRDQVNFACSHPRFASVFKLYAKLYYKTVRANDLENLSLWNIRQFLIFAGQFIEIFTGTFQHQYRDRVVNFIKVHCPNIQEIKLDTTKLKLPSLRKMLSNKPKLTTLNLTDCGISDHGMYAISKLSQLESLVISRTSNVTGNYLNSLKNLTKLRLFCCGYLQSSHLIKALSSMPNLRFLDLRGAEQLSKKVFEKLPQICTNLEVLQISCQNSAYDNIGKIPKLKNLSLSSSYSLQLRVELFHQLAKDKPQQLEFLQILPCLYIKYEQCEYIAKLESLKKLHLSVGPNLTDRCLSVLCQLKELVELKIAGCNSITNDGLLEMVLECKKLKWVNIRNTSIDNNFAGKLIQHLKRSERPSGRMTFLVAGSKIIKFCLPETYTAEVMKSLVYFEFNLPKMLKSYDDLSDAFEIDDLVMAIPFFSAELDYHSDSDDDSDFEDEFQNFLHFHFEDFEDFHDYHLGLYGDDVDDVLFW